MYNLRTVVLEDEDDNRNWLVKKLKQFSELEIVGEAATIDEAFQLIIQTKPDAAFMDIQLIVQLGMQRQGKSGTILRHRLPSPNSLNISSYLLMHGRLPTYYSSS